MGKRPMIGVMGGSDVSDKTYQIAYRLGELIAQKGYILVNGGRDAGVMRASAEGAKNCKGFVIGILPGDSKAEANEFIDIPIITNFGDARNVVNVLSSDIVVICPGAAGTISEAALALKNNKPVITFWAQIIDLFDEYVNVGLLHHVSTPSECIQKIERILMQIRV